MKDRYIRVTAPAGFDGQESMRDYYFKTRNAARDFRLRIKRWKAEQKSPADTFSFDDSDKRWLAYLKAHVGNLELLPVIVTHWERTARPIIRPLKVEELCKAFVLYREGKGLDKATLSEDRYISKRLQNIWAATCLTSWEPVRSVLFWIPQKLLILLSTNFTRSAHRFSHTAKNSGCLS
jgi:hypothetical protein